MTPQNRELMQRAIGIVEGVSLTVDDKVCNALACAVDMFLIVINSEGGADNE